MVCRVLPTATPAEGWKEEAKAQLSPSTLPIHQRAIILGPSLTRAGKEFQAGIAVLDSSFVVTMINEALVLWKKYSSSEPG
ncbi:hypothetical protein BDW60DRAFT_174780 [Aspergillus nidulans var. acristatus]